MRAAPIGLLSWQQPAGQLLRANATVQSHLTHHAPLCKAGSAAVAAAVAAALHARANGDSALAVRPLDAVQPAVQHAHALRCGLVLQTRHMCTVLVGRVPSL